MTSVNRTPPDDLLKEVRAQFILMGTSLNAYCETSELTRQNVSAALSGKWRGKKATELVHRVMMAAYPTANR